MFAALGFFFGILILSFLCDGLARWAGVRWNRIWAWLAVAVVAAVGAALGWLDGGATAAQAGAVLGLVFGQIGGTIVFGANAMFSALIFGPRPLDPEKPRMRPSFPRRLAILVAGSLPVGFAVVAAHEVFWMTNMLSCHAQFHVGLAMIEAEPSDDGQDALIKALQKTRWRLDVATHQPVRWLLHQDDEVTLRGTIAYIDLLEGKPAPAQMPAAWKHSIADEVLWNRWQARNGSTPGIPADNLRQFGVNIGNAAHARLNSQLEKTWLLRHLPREIFVNKDARQAND